MGSGGDSEIHVMSEEGQETLLALVSLCLLFIISTNALVIWLFCTHRSLRIVSNYYVLSLCVANLLAGGVGLPTEIMAFYVSNPSTTSCRVFEYAIHAIDCAEIYSLVLIAYDRRRVILGKPKTQSSSSRWPHVLAIGITWLLSLAYGARAPLMYDIAEYVVSDGNETTVIKECGVELHTGTHVTPQQILIAVDYVILFVFPLLLMSGFYAAVVHKLKEQTHGHSYNRRLKVLRIVLTLVLLFFLCNLPSRTLDVYVYLGPGPFPHEKVTREIFDLVKAINFGLNVVVYALVNDSYRQALKKSLRRVRRKCCPSRVGPEVIGTIATDAGSYTYNSGPPVTVAPTQTVRSTVPEVSVPSKQTVHH